MFSYSTRSSRLLTQTGIYRKRGKTGSNLVASVQSIMSELTNWLRDLPEHLRFDFTQLDKDISRESVSIFLHYYHCINMTARPLLFHVVQRRLEDLIRGQAKSDWRKELSPTTVAVIESCITAARASTAIMTAAAKQNLVATFGFMDGEHAFSAALLLVMINVAFPYNVRDGAAMESALAVLRGMAERGNTHIRARHSLLTDLQSVTGRLPTRQSRSSSTTAPRDQAAMPATIQTPPWSLEPTTDFNDISFDLNTTEDVHLWDEVSGNIGIGMDFDWIEAALRDEGIETGIGPGT
jgi:proline utilization trans-activator